MTFNVLTKEMALDIAKRRKGIHPADPKDLCKGSVVIAVVASMHRIILSTCA